MGVVAVAARPLSLLAAGPRAPAREPYEALVRAHPEWADARVRLASLDFEDWRFDAARAVDAGTGGKQEFVYYWKVPARVAGLWDWTLDFPVGLDGPRHYRGQIVQHWQDIEGRVDDDLLPMRLHDAGLDGTTIRFSVTGELGRRSLRQDYVGTVAGNRVEGHVTLRGPIQPTRFPWSAQRRRADN